MIFRKYSAFRWAFGSTNGRPHVVSAQANMYPRKLALAVTTMIQHTNKPPHLIEEAMRHVAKALDYMYRAMRIYDFQTQHSTLSLNRMKGMFMGASAGRHTGMTKVIRQALGEPLPTEIKVGPGKKKIDTFEADLEAILLFLRTGKKPSIVWVSLGKNEHFHDWCKQLSDKDWEAFCNKVRLFIIPSSVYILMEKMVSRIRHLMERGWVIQIGHAWPKGGADRLARCLGIDLTNCFAKILFEGDVKKFDQTVLEIFVNLYFSTMQIHEIPGTEEYDFSRRITKLLLENIIARVTNVFDDLWVVIKGGVPSGCYNTSHMDSWVMALYFFLFAVYQIARAPEEVQEKLEVHLLKIVRIIVYGDDHLVNIGSGMEATYFGAHLFSKFLLDHFNVTLRDINCDKPFVSEQVDGWLTSVGSTFLRHQFLLNPCKEEGQSVFLPSRESREVLSRAIWGREADSRDVLDVLMSCIGHAYGTYGANLDAYWRLRFLYGACLNQLGLHPLDLAASYESRIHELTIRKLRQVGVSKEELLGGFPDLDTLKRKNIVDWKYQDISRDDGGAMEEYVDWLM